MLYKVITACDMNKSIATGRVCSTHQYLKYSSFESWDNLSQALEELGQYGFKIVAEIRDSGISNGLVLCSESMSIEDNVERLIEKLSDKIAQNIGNEKKKASGWIERWEKDIAELQKVQTTCAEVQKHYYHVY